MKNTDKEQIEAYYKIEFDIDDYIESRRLYPLIKWAGGKEKELKYIIPNLPKKFVDYYEPFVGGGAVYTGIYNINQANNYYINDKSEELICLYLSITNGDRQVFFKILDEIVHNWALLTTVIQKYKKFFIQTYKEYSTDKIDYNKLKNILFEFILAHSDRFNVMFFSIFNFIRPNLTLSCGFS